MSTASLQDIMRDMSARIETLETDFMRAGRVKPLKEIEAYVSIDPVLADLYHQYLEAKRQYSSLVKLRGAHDPLTDVASDAVESADCAAQTRLLELRRDSKIRSVAEKRLAESKRRAAEILSAEKRQRQRDNYHSFLRQQKQKGEKTPADYMFMWFAGFLFLSFAEENIRRGLSIIYNFSNASYDYRGKAAA